ncbi:MAG: hypothetical protein AAB250_13995 [Bdellovibrionota bacterium]|mgnify:CR=1 FL=1
MKAFSFFFVFTIAMAASAADLECSAFIDGRGHTSAKSYALTPMQKDPTLLIAKVGEYSFVVDTIELSKNGSLRLFIHDLKADYTAMSDGVMKPIGRQKEARLQQIIGYDSRDPMTLSVSCYL